MGTKNTHDEKQLKNKLLQYSLAAGVALTIGTRLHAEIQYTNIDPDKTIAQAENQSTRDFLLDLNNDGTAEFKIFQAFSLTTYWFFDYYFYSENSVRQVAINDGLSVMRKTAENAYVAALDSNALISADQHFNANKMLGVFSYYDEQPEGFWPNAGQKFMGVKFKIGENIHYGWVRLSVAPLCESFILYDYAYEDEPGKAIKAGDTGIPQSEEHTE